MNRSMGSHEPPSLKNRFEFPHAPLSHSSRLMQLLGPGSEFGFKNLLPLFNLPQTVSVLATTRLGIRSVSATPPYPIKKSRYLSSTYWQLSL
jgi:hypothetical protein